MHPMFLISLGLQAFCQEMPDSLYMQNLILSSQGVFKKMKSYPAQKQDVVT